MKCQFDALFKCGQELSRKNRNIISITPIRIPTLNMEFGKRHNLLVCNECFKRFVGK